MADRYKITDQEKEMIIREALKTAEGREALAKAIVESISPIEDPSEPISSRWEILDI